LHVFQHAFVTSLKEPITINWLYNSLLNEEISHKKTHFVSTDLLLIIFGISLIIFMCGWSDISESIWSLQQFAHVKNFLPWYWSFFASYWCFNWLEIGDYDTEYLRVMHWQYTFHGSVKGRSVDVSRAVHDDHQHNMLTNHQIIFTFWTLLHQKFNIHCKMTCTITCIPY
jgi:hypothetical protein